MNIFQGPSGADGTLHWFLYPLPVSVGSGVLRVYKTRAPETNEASALRALTAIYEEYADRIVY